MDRVLLKIPLISLCVVIFLSFCIILLYPVISSSRSILFSFPSPKIWAISQWWIFWPKRAPTVWKVRKKRNWAIEAKRESSIAQLDRIYTNWTLTDYNTKWNIFYRTVRRNDRNGVVLSQPPLSHNKEYGRQKEDKRWFHGSIITSFLSFFV